MELNLEKEAALLETIFYLEAEAQTVADLAKISSLSKEVVEMALAQLKEYYMASNRGVELNEIGGGWQLVPKQEYWDLLKDKYGKKNDQKLSRAAMETLSIIAYSQPITRAEIEAIRGVSADNMIRLLFEKQLIKELGKKDAPGKPIQYGTSREFLKYFKLGSIADLPRLNELDEERFGLEE